MSRDGSAVRKRASKLRRSQFSNERNGDLSREGERRRGSWSRLVGFPSCRFVAIQLSGFDGCFTWRSCERPLIGS